MEDPQKVDADTVEASRRLMETESEAQELDLNSELFTNLLSEAPIYAIYEKAARIQARVANEGEAVQTILADGTIETSNTANAGDVIVTNPGGEQYIVPADKFNVKYSAVEGSPGEYQSIGEIRAIKNATGKEITITAPWGEKMVGGADSYIVSAYDKEHPDIISEDRYLIGGDEFAATYKLDQNETAKDYEKDGDPEDALAILLSDTNQEALRRHYGESREIVEQRIFDSIKQLKDYTIDDAAILNKLKTNTLYYVEGAGPEKDTMYSIYLPIDKLVKEKTLDPLAIAKRFNVGYPVKDLSERDKTQYTPGSKENGWTIDYRINKLLKEAVDDETWTKIQEQYAETAVDEKEHRISDKLKDILHLGR
jgi:hypothetical protein